MKENSSELCFGGGEYAKKLRFIKNQKYLNDIKYFKKGYIYVRNSNHDYIIKCKEYKTGFQNMKNHSDNNRKFNNDNYKTKNPQIKFRTQGNSDLINSHTFNKILQDSSAKNTDDRDVQSQSAIDSISADSKGFESPREITTDSAVIANNSVSLISHNIDIISSPDKETLPDLPSSKEPLTASGTINTL
ncbi:uncharacterized protein PMUG01_00052900 [Plasmodium malariae]|uniref:Uncharacterized protein n=1 Tax=Plasmodium malariae TaxID=5858 RepID=A0A1D3JHC1_PLAMA|nr:uncharacterized protein PMUG01_00052900 [Plasmodium malariae]SBT85707.1 hypothetical protein PMUG01_00052900 [Plasmodium malariae]